MEVMGCFVCESSRSTIVWILQEYYKERPNLILWSCLKINTCKIGKPQCIKEETTTVVIAHMFFGLY
jgi:hypothetical protein